MTNSHPLLHPPAGRPIILATDLDRTFTNPDLSLSSDAIRHATLLRRHGIRTILVTGRHAAHVPHRQLREAFDAFVIEGGAVWGKPGQWVVPSLPEAFWQAADSLADAGVEVEQGWASFSAPLHALSQLQGQVVNSYCNHDRIDVTPPGVDKGSGLRNALSLLSCTQPWLLALGDGDNDVPLLSAADVGVAVANASPALLAAATVQAPLPGALGFLWASGHLAQARGDGTPSFPEAT